MAVQRVLKPCDAFSAHSICQDAKMEVLLGLNLLEYHVAESFIGIIWIALIDMQILFWS